MIPNAESREIEVKVRHRLIYALIHLLLKTTFMFSFPGRDIAQPYSCLFIQTVMFALVSVNLSQ